MKRPVSLLVALTAVGLVVGTAVAAARRPAIASRPAPSDPPRLVARSVPKKPAHTPVPQGYSRQVLHVKFVEGSQVRLSGQDLVAPDPRSSTDLAAFLASPAVAGVERMFPRSDAALVAEKTRIEAKSRREQADKSLYFRIRLAPDARAEDVLDALNALPIVEIAYPEPLAMPLPVTPNFTPQQGYRNAAPGGIDADIASRVCAGRGDEVRIIDIEYSWNQSHEDLSKAASALIANGTFEDPFGSTNHGTAVLGEMIADDNGIGVTGAVHRAALNLVNANTTDGYRLAAAIDLAHANLVAGDLILIEQQIAGPNGCDADTQVGCVAVEWIQAYYDAIVAATSDGILVVEAAGNGAQDLGDTGTYGDPFPSGRADSGAIVVGAGAAPTCSANPRSRLGFSNFGPRVNVQGWGQCVATTGYGFLHVGAGMNEWYTGSFGGTSSASPIVTSAAASVSSAAQSLTGSAPLPTAVRSLLISTGTAQDTGPDSGHIGPLPNLRLALAAYETDGPTTTCPGAFQEECTSPSGAHPTYSASAVDDCDPTPAVACTPSSGSAFGFGATSVSCHGTDAVGNVGADCSFDVTVVDTTPPVLVCPSAVVTECTGNNGTPPTNPAVAAFLAGASATDVCDASVPVTNDAPGFFPLGVTPVEFTAADDHTNESTCTRNVTVQDTIAPVGEITFPTNGACFGPPGVPVTITDSFADLCDPALDRTYVPAAPPYVAHGDYHVTLTVKDNALNQAQDDVSFTIDLVPPAVAIITPPLDQTGTTPLQYPIQIAFTASDNDGASGGIVHEIMQLQGCTIYDGNTYGDDDGLLSDELFQLTKYKLCQLMTGCHFLVLDLPRIRVEATDACGNVSARERIIRRRLLKTEVCTLP